MIERNRDMEWTQSALEEKERYLAEVRARATAQRADADDAVEMARRRLEHEIAALNNATITADDVRQAIGQMRATPPRAAAYAVPARRRPWSAFFLLLLGVALPLAALLTELFTGACAGMFFDPIPSPAHIILIALVPLTHALAWWFTRPGRSIPRPGWLGMLIGLSFGVALYYALLFLPVIPFAGIGLIGIIYFGIGLLALLPMAPMFAFAAAFISRSRLRNALPGRPRRAPGIRLGIALSIPLVLLAALPDALSRIGLALAASADPGRQDRGIRLLRLAGEKDFLLKACYQRMDGPTDLLTLLAFLKADPNTDKARGIFYRVYGEDYRKFPPPSDRFGWRRTRVTEFEFDNDQGGDTVAGRLKGLTLTDSRLDGSIDPAAALAYLEWTMVFRNESRWQREARAIISLPPGAVVSRLTLWIDGEEREAAFGGRSQTKQAYQKVVQRRRDPVLVTTCGPDRILAQCFPVPPNGGEMKFRLGITTPLKLDAADSARLILPFIRERNFGLGPAPEHAIWIDAKSPLTAVGAGLQAEQTGPDIYTLRGALTDTALASLHSAITLTRDPAQVIAWAADTIAGSNAAVVQTITAITAAPPARVAVVIDGSAAMQSLAARAAEALATLPDGLEFALLLAGDRVVPLVELQSITSNTRQRVAASLRHAHFVGGQDNAPALSQAWDLAAGSTNGAVLWIHQPQAVLISSVEELRQKMERRPDRPIIIDYETRAGPDRIVEKLDGLRPLRQLARQESAELDLRRLFKSWQAPAEVWVAIRTHGTLQDVPAAEAHESSLHLVRLWAAERVQELVAENKPTNAAEAIRTALDYHLVTPVSGAVVLESAQQYAEANLQPVAPGTVPTIPEPELWWLIAVVAAALAGLIIKQRGLLAQPGK